MSYKIFLDDERLPKQIQWIDMPLGPWMIVRNYDTFVRHVKDHGLPSFVSFDHDLADEHHVINKNDPNIFYDRYTEKTGYDCAKWLCSYCQDNNLLFPEYQIHSMNSIGRENIRSYIESYKNSSEIFKRI
jgi:hypothetical protein